MHWSGWVLGVSIGLTWGTGACGQTATAAQRSAEPEAFLRANEDFGAGLLMAAHERLPGKNVVVAPLGVSLAFAAVADNTFDMRSRDEIVKAFRWEETLGLAASGRMLLARFAQPKPRPRTVDKPDDITGRLMALRPHGELQGLWLKATFIYRDTGAMSKQFIERVKEDFGLEFRAVGAGMGQGEALEKNGGSAVPMPRVTGSNDFWISSVTHLRTSWAGNTFVEAKRRRAGFTLASGVTEGTEFLTSELSDYVHAQTEEFEAVKLKGTFAYIVFVLPAQGNNIVELERELAKHAGMVDEAMRLEMGDVRMPPFHFVYEADLRESLEGMGVHMVFGELNSLRAVAPEEGARLRGVLQRTEIAVDESGIRADSATIVTGVFGGIFGGQAQAFHMALNRPFLFFVRDNVTEALLFAGAVMDPRQE